MYGQGYHAQGSNQQCASCGNFADKFCICKETVTILCANCIPMHEYQLHNEQHDLNPISQLSVLYNLGNIPAFRAQKHQLMQGSSLASQLEQCEMQQYLKAKERLQAATMQYEQWLDYLHQCFLSLIAKFNYEKNLPMSTNVYQLSQFTFCIYGLGETRWPQEAELVETGPLQKLENEVAALQVYLHRNCGNSAAFEEYYVGKVKSGLQPPAPAMEMPPAHVTYSAAVEVPQAVPSRQISLVPAPHQSLTIVPKQVPLFVPFSRGSLLAKWDAKTTNLDKVKLSRNLNFTNLTVTVVLPDGNLFCCGGKEPHENRAVLIDATDGSVTSLSDMRTGRSNPGIVLGEQLVYLFGGFQDGGKTKLDNGEKFSFHSKVWTAIPGKMSTPRYQFSPCQYEDKIYLAGGWDTVKTDQFDINTERYSVLPFDLPKPFGTTAIGFNGELVIVQDTKLIRWKIGSGSGKTQSQGIGLSAKDSNVAVQVFGTKAYYTCETDTVCEIHELDLTTWKVIKAAGLSAGTGIPCQVS